MSAQVLLVTYALMAPLVVLHTRWVMERRCADDPEVRLDTEQTVAIARTSRWGIAAVAGLAWPLVLVGYVLSAIAGNRRPDA